jgi:hypothetical protein
VQRCRQTLNQGTLDPIPHYSCSIFPQQNGAQLSYLQIDQGTQSVHFFIGGGGGGADNSGHNSYTLFRPQDATSTSPVLKHLEPPVYEDISCGFVGSRSYSVKYSVVPMNSSLLTITLYSSVGTTLVYSDTKYLVPFTTLYPSLLPLALAKFLKSCKTDGVGTIKQRGRQCQRK